MLLLTEGTLFFWNIARSDGSKTKEELQVSRITSWRGSVVAGPKEKGHSRTLGRSSSLANPFLVVKARRTTVSDDALSQTHNAPDEKLVGGFGDEPDDSQERAALSKRTVKPGQVRQSEHINVCNDVCLPSLACRSFLL